MRGVIWKAALNDKQVQCRRKAKDSLREKAWQHLGIAVVHRQSHGSSGKGGDFRPPINRPREAQNDEQQDGAQHLLMHHTHKKRRSCTRKSQKLEKCSDNKNVKELLNPPPR